MLGFGKHILAVACAGGKLGKGRCVMGEKVAAGAKPDLAAALQTQLDAPAREGGTNGNKTLAVRFDFRRLTLRSVPGDAAALRSLPWVLDGEDG